MTLTMSPSIFILAIIGLLASFVVFNIPAINPPAQNILPSANPPTQSSLAAAWNGILHRGHSGSEILAGAWGRLRNRGSTGVGVVAGAWHGLVNRGNSGIGFVGGAWSGLIDRSNALLNRRKLGTEFIAGAWRGSRLLLANQDVGHEEVTAVKKVFVIFVGFEGVILTAVIMAPDSFRCLSRWPFLCICAIASLVLLSFGAGAAKAMIQKRDQATWANTLIFWLTVSASFVILALLLWWILMVTESCPIPKP